MTLTRRTFLGSTAAGLTLGLRPGLARSANEKIVVGVMGTSRSNSGKNPGRGATLAHGFATLPGCEVAYVCDVDQVHLDAVAGEVEKKQGKAPKAVKDFRRILDDKAVDALIIATPDHWHAIAGILACQAGKHAYVEKPCSHNAREAELLVAAARKYNRVVQHGTQRRSWPVLIEAVQALRQGAIGKVLSAQCFYLFSDRPTIGHGKSAPTPERLDWALWQGPAPEREYRDNYLHYNWHWFWHWGTAELGNNGVHSLDVGRWGLGVDYPVQVSSMGSKLRYEDDQETPDTHVATFRFANGSMMTWEGRSWGGKTPADPLHQVAWFGDKGTMTFQGSTFQVYDAGGQPVHKGSSSGGDAVHLQNFLDAIRGAAKANAEIEEGYKSTLLCHLGNISHRAGKTLAFDAATKRPAGDDRDVAALWGREYRDGWEPKV